jgi:hypothetical protein
MANSVGDETLLEGAFTIHQQSSAKFNVTVTKSQIRYAAEVADGKKPTVNIIKFADTIGCDCMRGKSPDFNSSYLNIYAYPHHKKVVGKSTVRKRKLITLIFNQSQTFEENHKESSRWQLVLTYLIRNMDIQSVQGIIMKLI